MEDLITILRWIAFAPLAIFFVWVTAFNYFATYVWIRECFGRPLERHYSLGPLLGGIGGFLAFRISPIETVQSLAPFAFVIDPGCFLYFCILFPYYFIKNGPFSKDTDGEHD